MVTYDGVAAVLATGGAIWLVVREAAPPRTPRPRPVPAPVAERPRPPERDGSMLGAIAVTEADEQPPLRRVGALVALLAITLAAALMVGVFVYRGVSGLG